jgi:uncharacterized protein YfaS (alpha-2-macroglobulin family)
MLFSLLGFVLPTLALAFTVEFQPQGLAKGVRQARAVFNEAIVPFGDPRVVAPFTVKCSAPGTGLWEDSRTWIFEFKEELSSGEQCEFTPQANLRSLKGSKWANAKNYSFHTGGPKVKSSRPDEGATIEEATGILLNLDGPVDLKSLGTNAFFLVEGLPERIPVTILPENTRIEMAANAGYNEEEVDAPSPARFSVAIAPSRPLPSNRAVQLVWAKEIASPAGRSSDSDQIYKFKVRPAFTATFSCTRENANADCLPLGEFSLELSNPIKLAQAKKIFLTSSSGKRAPKVNEEDELVYSLRFPGPHAPRNSWQIELPKGLQDEAGRPLENAAKFPLSFKTADFPPLAKFAATFGVLEAADPVLPVTLRKVEEKLSARIIHGQRKRIDVSDPASLLTWLARLHDRANNYLEWRENGPIDHRDKSLLATDLKSEKFEIRKPLGPEAFEVVGIPLREKGFHVVELESRLLGESLMGKPRPMFVAAGALVTDLGVHFKWGKENSLVWVTQLATGNPVSGASVKVVDCGGKELWRGITEKDGSVLAKNLPAVQQARSCEGAAGYQFRNGLFVLAEKAGDFSFSHTSWDEGIEPWRFQVPFEAAGRESVAHTVFDRTLFRTGQTVHMKHFLRESYLTGIRFRRGKLPTSLVLEHSSGQKLVMPAKFSRAGGGETKWQIPEGARLGTYTLYLTTAERSKLKGDFSVWGEDFFRTGEFRVEDFRLPVLAGEISWAPGGEVAPKELLADLTLRYLNGGAAGGMKVSFRAQAEKTGAKFFPAFEGITFANGGVKEGKVKKQDGADASVALPVPALNLDGGGAGRVKVAGLPAWDVPYQVRLEAEFRDPNGEIQTISRRQEISPSTALVGIQPDGWASSQELVKFKVAVVSPEGRPLASRKVNVRWLERKSYSHRRRIVGGFYAYESTEEITAQGEACRGETSKEGFLYCEGKAPASGSLLLQAEVEEGGRMSLAHQDIWVTGKDDWWFPAENNDRIDFLPESKQYEPGAVARLQLRMPYREAEVLVTVEREGIIHRFVKKVSGKNPVIEVPVKASYAPNVFISALVVRGRVGEPKATALVDLAKPAYRVGLAEIQVGWKAHELKVRVEPVGTVFKVRDKAKVRLSVVRAMDGKAPKGGKVLFLAVDEALLEIRPNASWQLLSAMMGRRPLRVHTSTAQSLIVGKRHFGLKALPSGGGGVVASARELFDTLLVWKGEVALDESGKAEVEVPLNDSLSSFRLVAIATEGADRFGTGESKIQTRQDLMLFSGVAPLAREGDRTNPELTVRNGSNRELNATVLASVAGAPLPEKKLTLAPGAASVLRWEYAVPKNVTSLSYEFTARAEAGLDVLKVSQKVVPVLRESVLQGTLERLDKPLALNVQPPLGMKSGKVEVRLAKTIGSNLDAVKEYMRLYPHHCFEQQISRAVALQEEKAWDRLMKSMPQYLDKNGLIKFFPGMENGSEILTAYVLAIGQEAGYSIPEERLPEMLAAMKNFVLGKSSPGFTYPGADLGFRKIAAVETLSRYQSFEPSLLDSLSFDPEMMPMAALLDWQSVLTREQAVPGRVEKLARVAQAIRTKVHYRGTVLGFHSDENYWWLMGSTDQSVNRLLHAAVTDPKWKEDIGRLVRGALARQKQGKWDLTTANAWGVLAMKKYSAAFEKGNVSGESVIRTPEKSTAIPWRGGEAFASLPFEKKEYVVEHKGQGSPWAFLYPRAAVELSEPIHRGYQVKRTITPVEQQTKGRWRVGDVYRVKLELDASADMSWVAVSDPAPAGASVLGTGLGRDSALLSQGDKKSGGWLAHEEKSFEGYRAYYEWLPKGKATLEYTVRLNGAGTFHLPNTRVEAMYAPEMYSESPNAKLVVEE